MNLQPAITNLHSAPAAPFAVKITFRGSRGSYFAPLRNVERNSFSECIKIAHHEGIQLEGEPLQKIEVLDANGVDWYIISTD